MSLRARKWSSLAVVVCEASSGYERKLVSACYQADIPIHVAHANKIRSFVKAQGLIAKTDKMLSDYCCLMKVKPRALILSKNAEHIKEILNRRNQLIKGFCQN